MGHLCTFSSSLMRFPANITCSSVVILQPCAKVRCSSFDIAKCSVLVLHAIVIVCGFVVCRMYLFPEIAVSVSLLLSI